MKFFKAKNVASTSGEVEKVVKKPGVVNEKIIVNNPKQNVTRPKAKGRSLPTSKRGPQTQHFCHHCGSHRHTRANCFKLQALKNVDSQRLQRKGEGAENVKQANARVGDLIIGDMIRMIEHITTGLASFTPRFENYVSITPPLGTSPQTHMPCG